MLHQRADREWWLRFSSQVDMTSLSLGAGVARAAARSSSFRIALPASRERARRRIVALVLLLFLLVMVEGILRKWVAPEYSRVLFFVRDPFLVWAYWLATRHGLWPLRSAWFRLVLGMMAFGLMLAALQSMIGGASEQRLVLTVHGFRSYFLYIPLAFLVAATFRGDDLARLYRWTLWLALPVAVLVTAQFFAPPGAPINVGIAAEEELQFRGLQATSERTRPMGPFASGVGQQQFVATCWVIAVGLLITASARRGVGAWTLWAGLAATLVCIGLSGSRGTVLQCGLAMVFALALGLVGRSGALKSRAIAWSLGLSAAALILYPLLLPEGFATFMERWTAADAAERRHFESGVFGRALYSLVDFVRLFEHVPLLGYGLGYGSNASITMKASVDGVMPGFLAETDFSRHMVDLGPVFALAYIAFRLAFTLWLAALVLRVTRRVADPMPVLLLSYVALVISSGQLTGQGAINFYGWLFAGVLMAACAQAGGAPPMPLPTRLPLARKRILR
jgi:hypothetical protein